MQQTGPRPSDKFIPYYFVVFFVLLAALLFWFARLAITTNTGVITEDAYNKGLAYNATISEAEHQQELGWNGTIEIKNNILTYRLLDNNNSPILNAKVKAFFIRPTTEGFDKEFTLSADGKGNYSVPVQLGLNGLWDVTIVAYYAHNNYQQHKRLVLNG